MNWNINIYKQCQPYCNVAYINCLLINILYVTIRLMLIINAKHNSAIKHSYTAGHKILLLYKIKLTNVTTNERCFDSSLPNCWYASRFSTRSACLPAQDSLAVENVSATYGCVERLQWEGDEFHTLKPEELGTDTSAWCCSTTTQVNTSISQCQCRCRSSHPGC